ncbi:aminodeoxychorismate lyase [Bacterioplanes sanyensis]|uniref:Aminodeoxychorismate lyase n=1 Tax=Bacterioplanes sanyensis TaxID=1249553 RepID=A0A222FMT2_9GAMM|nr:aminodeoxychorismate lyase [Bacterioplanes sanyensis]ASP39876.1 aminodeoxychorismate lyase [Bacterioplanes sanyensis]
MSLLQWYCAGQPVAAPDIHRAAQFGDGLFETMRCDDSGAVPLWPWHRQRLRDGLLALDFPIDTLAHVDVAMQHFVGGNDSVIAAIDATPQSGLKLSVSRGSGGRGYGYDDSLVPLVLLQYFAAPAWSAAPLVVTVSDVRLASQPLLAGIKHMNRLEQVLARGRVDACWDDCLLLDQSKCIVESSAGNVFAWIDGGWQTPSLAQCGVKGIARRWLLERSGARVSDLHVDQLTDVDTLLICNALRGPQLVSRVDQLDLPSGRQAQVTEWQLQWQQLFCRR